MLTKHYVKHVIWNKFLINYIKSLQLNKNDIGYNYYYTKFKNSNTKHIVKNYLQKILAMYNKDVTQERH